jgi:hypothetical protein
MSLLGQLKWNCKKEKGDSWSQQIGKVQFLVTIMELYVAGEGKSVLVARCKLI